MGLGFCKSLLTTATLIMLTFVTGTAKEETFYPEGSAPESILCNSGAVFTNGTASSISTYDQGGTKIKVYLSQEDKVVEMDLDEYIKGVIYAEMPLYYDIEALKAQAVAARSYTLHRIGDSDTHKEGAIVCTDYSHCQAWRDISDMEEVFGSEQGQKYLDKINEAVYSTSNVVITYKGEIINAMYFSNSGGYTEDISDVWTDCCVEYLQSVASPGEQKEGDYSTFYRFTKDEMITAFQKYGVKYDEIKDIERSDTGRILSLKVGDRILSGTAVRKILNLRSTNAYFEFGAKGDVVVLCFGYGHGVGMSQAGAGAMGAEGAKYDEILKHYYTGVNVEWRNLSKVIQNIP